MFQKVLIANRGEIALRIIKTCKELGIKTVAVYSEADKEAIHVKEADESYLIGEAQVFKSYLNMEKVLEVAIESKADAIHPGYGLLSENTKFAEKCTENKITFIGPSIDSMAKMALKVESRELAHSVGVPIVPGTDSINSIEELHEKANEIGYPVLLKASAGGGGIGMEKVESDENLERAFKMAQNRAKAFFANPDVYIEKFVEEPRHIEVQVFADGKGKYIHLGERECSIQRRHQKLIEESPSTFVDNELRKKITESAIKLSEAVKYKNAGTVEFIVSNKTKEFYFLEMNTRLQVEHPVTEKVTGLDLVKMQLEVAYSNNLTESQEDISFNGHAIELRLYAENPDKNFMPSPGKITKLHFPEIEGIRIDTGIYEGYTVTPFYDPMLAKVISYGSDRDKSINQLLAFLKEAKIEGIKNNLEFFQKVLENEEFKKGNTTTDFISKYM